jgi:predicted RND superfamily exporter protein
MMTRGLLAMVQLELSMVSSMLTAVVMVIGVATMVHVIVRFRESRSMGLSTMESLQRTCRILAVPIFWACITDAVGFLALTVSSVGPVQDFGIMMAIGSLMVLVAVVLIMPGSVLLGRYDSDPRAPWGENRLVARLQSLLSAVARRPRRFLVGIVTVTVVAIAGLTFLDVETDFTRNFRSGSEIVRAYKFVEEHLGGAGVCDIVIPAPELAELDWEFLSQVHQLEKQIRADDAPPSAAAITNSFSLSDALFDVSPVPLESQPRFFRDRLVQTGLTAMKGWMPEFFYALHGKDPESDQHYLRVMLRVHERQSADDKKELIEHLNAVSTESFPNTEVTGYFVLLTHLIDSVIRDQWRTFLVAVLSIGLIMWISLRDLRLAFIALVPNAFPILIVLGGMGWVSAWVWDDLRINMGTAMIAAVSMGLSIDSSIHYMIGFQRARREGLSVADSLRRVQESVGKAMVLSTLALTVGFSVLATSQFVPTVYFGTLVSLSMLGGLAGNLVVLPALLQTLAPSGRE